MTLRRMWDAAWPPTHPPAWEAVAGYIGGNTPHVWSDDEWAAAGARWRLPIFVRSAGGDPNADADEAVAWLRGHGVPPGSSVALDFETRVDAGYVRTFDFLVQQAGYVTVLYGSRGTVLRNPRPSGGYWDAEWTNAPHLNRGSAATQYGGDTTLGQPYDASLVADATPLWDVTGHHQEVLMALTDEEQQEVLKAARQINGAVAAGQTSFQGTVEAILGTVQALVNEGRSQATGLSRSITDLRSAVLGAVAALPAPETPEQAAAVRDQLLEALAHLGVEGLSPDALLDALHARLAA